MSDLNIIPEAVMPVGPMFQQLPNELWLEILKIHMMVMPLCKSGTLIDKKRFDIINAMTFIGNLRLVSKTFAFLAMEAFYAGNHFVLRHINFNNHLSAWGTSMPPCLPPVCFRACLRRLHIDIPLEDTYFITQAGDYNLPLALRIPTRHPVRSVKDLMKYCPGARLLASLTNAIGGFPGLVHLDLHIWTDFRCGNEAALAVIKEAAFAVRARKVVVTVPLPTSRYFEAGSTFTEEVMDEQEAAGRRCPKVRDLIAVEQW